MQFGKILSKTDAENSLMGLLQRNYKEIHCILYTLRIVFGIKKQKLNTIKIFKN